MEIISELPVDVVFMNFEDLFKRRDTGVPINAGGLMMRGAAVETGQTLG